MLKLKFKFLVIAAALPFSVTAVADEPHPIIIEVYDAFQTGELERWNAVMHADVVINSSAGFGNTGIDAAKTWANEFLVAFSPRVDLVDFIDAIGDDGDGRAVISFNLNWKHVEPFFDVLQPTGREGTSIENLILTVKDGLVTRMEVADGTLDLVIYMHENGWAFPQNIRPEPLIRGIERPVTGTPIRLHN
ncbi:MAG: hypothetical protein QNJ14_04130 [Woeseiaceae bacterium]|nr:hypothetical protein [Woeseiaceae bacterium]